jgi:clan AA aspartic protease
MNGRIDDSGRALLSLGVRLVDSTETHELIVWVDTAFDGELVVPAATINALGLQQSAAVQATLADGTQVVLETYHCELNWFGSWRKVEVVANEGRLPLLGVGLLRHRRLVADYRTNELTLD